jgi:hypothetical protein
MSLQAIAAIAAAAHMTMLDRSKFRLGRQASCGDVEAQTDLGSCRGFVVERMATAVSDHTAIRLLGPTKAAMLQTMQRL